MKNLKFLNTILLAAMVMTLFVACSGVSNLTIFNIGDSREKVINTIVSDFKIRGKKPNKDWVLNKENGNHITMYDCEYRGQQYGKVRVYYSEEKVRRLELEIDKDKIQDILGNLESSFGTPHRTSLPYILGTTIDANVFMGEVEAIVLMERDDYYEIMVVSGDQRDLINRSM